MMCWLNKWLEVGVWSSSVVVWSLLLVAFLRMMHVLSFAKFKISPKKGKGGESYRKPLLHNGNDTLFNLLHVYCT